MIEVVDDSPTRTLTRRRHRCQQAFHSFSHANHQVLGATISSPTVAGPTVIEVVDDSPTRTLTRRRHRHQQFLFLLYSDWMYVIGKNVRV